MNIFVYGKHEWNTNLIRFFICIYLRYVYICAYHSVCIYIAQVHIAVLKMLIMQFSNYSSIEGVLYCKPHYDQLFKMTGSLDKSFEGIWWLIIPWYIVMLICWQHTRISVGAPKSAKIDRSNGQQVQWDQSNLSFPCNYAYNLNTLIPKWSGTVFLITYFSYHTGCC